MSHVVMAAPRPLVHRQSAMMETFRDHSTLSSADLKQKQLDSNPALTVAFENYDKCITLLMNYKNRNVDYFATMSRKLKTLVLFSFEDFPEEHDRRVLGDQLVAIGFVHHAIDYYNLVLDELGITAVTLDFLAGLSPEEEEQYSVIYKIREILWNFSDSSNSFSEAIAKTDLLHKLAADLDAIVDDGVHTLETCDDLFPFNSAVGIIHNCTRNPMIDKDVFRKIGMVGSILPFLKSRNLYVKMTSILAVGNIIKENELETLDADTDIFDFILNAMKQASLSKNRKEYGFHLAELCDGLVSLAKSDRNKQLIMEKEPLRLIKDLLKGNNITEILAAIKLVWVLAFLSANQAILSREKDILKAIKSLCKNKNEGISLAATKALFVLEGRDELLKEDDSSGHVGMRGKHIMFSYNWVDGDTVKKIYEALKAKGYPLWIDTEESGKFDSIMKCMKYGVENAYVILVCYSESYKNSPNCRTEAEFAFRKRKEIVPLKMQRDYNPDGWLGPLIGSRFFVEFSPKKTFETQIDAIEQQLERFNAPNKDPAEPTFKPELPPDNVPANHSQHAHFEKPHPQKPSPISRKLKDWKKHDVEYWAKNNELEGYAFKRITALTGEQLCFVYSLLIKKPDTFYRWVETNLRLGSIEDLMRFHDALQSLVTYV